MCTRAVELNQELKVRSCYFWVCTVNFVGRWVYNIPATSLEVYSIYLSQTREKTLREPFGISRHGNPIKMLHKVLPFISCCNDQRINRNFCHKLLVLLRNQTGACHKLVLGDVPFKIQMQNAHTSHNEIVQTTLIQLYEAKVLLQF